MNSVRLLLLPLVCVLAWGCANNEPTRFGPKVQVRGDAGPTYLSSQDIRFDDLPVPPGMQLDEERSWAFMNKDTRACSLRYTGRISLPEAEWFMKTQMKVSQWDFRSSMAGDLGQAHLEFSKRDEECRIRLWSARRFPLYNRRTTMVVEIFSR